MINGNLGKHEKWKKLVEDESLKWHGKGDQREKEQGRDTKKATLCSQIPLPCTQPIRDKLK